MSTPEQLGTGFLQTVAPVFPNRKITLGLGIPLMGGENPIDSVTLVEICVRLEDYASELGFEFDWTSETAMSRSRSIFLNVDSLFDEFRRQMKLDSA